MLKIVILASLAVVGLGGLHAWATVVPVASFDSPPAGGGISTIWANGTFGSPANWTVTSGSVDVIGTGFSQWSPPDGHQTVDLDGSSVGAISTPISIPSAGTVEVEFFLAGNYRGGPAIKQLQVSLGAVNQTFSFDTTGHNANNMGWVSVSAIFANQSAGVATLAFRSLDGPLGGSYYGPVIGTVTASVTPVPEPSTMGAGLGTLGIMLMAIGARSRRSNVIRLDR